MSLGRLLETIERLSVSKEGICFYCNRPQDDHPERSECDVKRGGLGDGVKRVHETRSTPNYTKKMEIEQATALGLARLTIEERQVMDLRDGMMKEIHRKVEITDEVWPEYERLGYVTDELVPNTNRRKITLRIKEDNMQLYERIGRRLNLSARQVERRVVTANRKMKQAVAL